MLRSGKHAIQRRDPVRSFTVIVGLEKLRAKFLLRRRKVVPCQRALNDMRVRVYPSHVSSFMLAVQRFYVWIIESRPDLKC